MKGTIAVLLALLLIAAARPPITVEQGERVTLAADTGSLSPGDTVAAEFSIPRTDINYYITDNDPTSPVIRQPVRFDLEPGRYEMRIRTWVNNELTSYDTVQITVRRPQAQQPETAPSRPVLRQNTIHIDPIPDATPGSTFIIPVRVTGQGEYLVEIPRLTFAVYEVPDVVTVDGTDTVPVLLHIDEDAEPGIYAIPVRVGDDEATARLRIIKYQEQEASWWWILIPIGIILIAAGLYILLTRRQPRRIEPVPPPRTKSDTDLITYY